MATTDDGPDVRLRMFRPAGLRGLLPCVYWIQGGGYVLTSPDLDDAWCDELALRNKCAAISVDWRRAPEYPFPAAADDCYAGLRWLVGNANTLGVDLARIVVGGASSGGGSAASLALMVRDRSEFSIAHQLLIYPMLDDSSSTASCRRITEPRLWNQRTNQVAWRHYLGSSFGTENVSPYAAPARMRDLSGVAPATVLTGELDLFVDEDTFYAQRLMDDGVSTELHVYRGAPHGFDRMNPQASVTVRFVNDVDQALALAFAS